jgi:hypothetical protein
MYYVLEHKHHHHDTIGRDDCVGDRAAAWVDAQPVFSVGCNHGKLLKMITGVCVCVSSHIIGVFSSYHHDLFNIIIVSAQQQLAGAK